MLNIPWRTGANLREFAYYGTPVIDPGDPENRPHLQNIQLDALRAINVKLIRFWASHRDFTTDQSIEHVREALRKIKMFGMQAIVCLDDSVRDSSLFVPGHENITPFWGHGHYDVSYYNEKKYQAHYLPHIEKIVTAFANDSTVFAWELMNEPALHPQPFEDPDYNPTRHDFNSFLEFSRESSGLIRSIAPRQLISLGTVSVLHVVSHAHGEAEIRRQALELYSLDTIDLVSIHFYGEDGEAEEDKRKLWDVDIAKRVGKPFYLGEVGATKGRWQGDRAEYHRSRFQTWKDLGAFSALVWQFNELQNDLRISDGVSRRYGDFENVKSAFASFSENAATFTPANPLPGSSGRIIKATTDAEDIKLQVFHEKQPIYMETNRSGPKLANRMNLYALTNVDPATRQEKNDFVWWQMNGWVVERSVDVDADSPQALLKRKDNPEKILQYRVVYRKGLNIRSDTEVSDATLIGEFKHGDIVAVLAESSVTDDDYVWWQHQGALNDAASDKAIAGWSAEKTASGRTVYLEPASNKVIETRVNFEVATADQPIHLEASSDSDIIADAMVQGSILTVDPKSRTEKDGQVWWKVNAWVVERPVAVDEGTFEAFLHPYNAAAYREFRVAQSGQDVYIEPGGDTLANDLTQDSVIDVDVNSQIQHGTDIWWKLKGWIVERPVEVTENDPGVFLQRLFPPKKAVYRVNTTGTLAIRSDPSVPNDNEPDNLIKRVQSGTEIVAFEGDAYVHTGPTYVWRRHEQGWSAEQVISSGDRLLVKQEDVEMPPEVKFLILENSQPMFPVPDTDSEPIAARLTKDSMVEVNPDSRFERDGLVWWEVEAWVKERSIYTGEGEPGVFLQPTADGEVSRFRIMTSRQDLFPEPDPNAEPIAIDLSPNLIVDVDPKSRERRRGLVWWKVEGWVPEKELPEEGEDDPVPFLEELPPPESATMKFRVVNKAGVWIRSAPGVPPAPFTRETIIGDLEFGEVISVIKASRVVEGDYIFWQHADEEGNALNKWTAEDGPTRTYMEPVEEAPPITKFEVKQDGLSVHTGPGDTTAKLAASLRNGAILYADTKSRRTRNKKVWWKISAWIVERRADVPPRDPDALLMPHNDENTVQFLVAAPDRDILGGPETSEKRIASGLRQGAIIDTEASSYLKQDGFVWRKVNGWVVEREAGQPDNDAALVRQEIEVDLDTKIKFQVVYPGDVNVRASAAIPPRSKRSNVLGEVKTGQLVEAYAYDQDGTPGPLEDKAGYSWWRHDSGQKENRPDTRIENGWTAEKHVDADGNVTTFMKRLDDASLRPTIAFRVQKGEPVFLIPDKSAGTLAERLSVGGTIFVDEHSRFEQDGLIWWRMSGWVAEREDHVTTGHEDAFLQPANEQKMARFRVVFQGDINVRSDAVFVAGDSNVLGEAWTGDIIQAYADSRTESGEYVWWRHDAGRAKGNPEQRVPDGWCAELRHGSKEVVFLERLPDGDGSNDPIEPFYQQDFEKEINVNVLPGRDRLFDRPPVSLTDCFILQHYGNTQEAFKTERYKDVFQGMHSGIDFAILRGQDSAREAIIPVYAGVTGKVVQVYTRFYRPVGVKVRVGAIDIIYGHLGANYVGVGMEVRPDMKVGHIANDMELQVNGPFFFPHLHFEIRFNKTSPERCLNPLMFYPPELRQAIIRTTTHPATNHFFQGPMWNLWGTVLEQPVIKLGGGLIGPLASGG